MNNNNNKDTFIKIPKIWIGNGNTLLRKYGCKNSNVGDIAFAFYIYCLTHQLRFDNGSIISISQFLDLFGFTNRATRASKKKDLIKSIEHMQEDKLITFYSDFAFDKVISFDEEVKDTTLQYVVVNTFGDEPFIRLYKHELVKIFDAESNRLPLLIHFVAVMSFENNNSLLCYPSLDTLATLTRTSQDTCVKYNETLQEIELFYYRHAGMKWLGGNEYQSYTNTYARHINKHLVDEYINRTIEENKANITNINKEKQARGNYSRSLKGRINHLEKIDRTPEQEETLIALVDEYTELRAKIDKQANEDWNSQLEQYKQYIPQSEGKRIDFWELEDMGYDIDYDTGEVIQPSIDITPQMMDEMYELFG